ncbi:hypothetical protein D3C76_1765160 [compost metagenome]
MTSLSLIRLTLVLELGLMVISFWLASCNTASRSGVLEMSSCAHSSFSLITSPGCRRREMIAERSNS